MLECSYIEMYVKYKNVSIQQIIKNNCMEKYLTHSAFFILANTKPEIV